MSEPIGYVVLESNPASGLWGLPSFPDLLSLEEAVDELGEYVIGTKAIAALTIVEAAGR